MYPPTIKDILKNTQPGGEVTVTGWVRSRRDSKAGLSFVAVYDGSTFDPIQLVIENTLSNYDTDILKLSAGCAVTASGTLVESEGKGQSVEIQATRVEASAHQCVWRNIACAHHLVQCYSQLFLSTTVSLG